MFFEASIQSNTINEIIGMKIADLKKVDESTEDIDDHGTLIF